MIRAVALLLALAGVARAQQPVAACEEPNVLIVLDRSGSMLEGRKWEQATEAITQVVRTFEHVIRFGLMVFPWQGPCFVERSQAVRVPPAPLNGPAVRRALPGLRPERDGATPLGTALDEASGYLIGQSLDGRRGFIVILTDGMETCDGNPVRAAEGAFTIDGFPVFVIGFGGGVDRGTLNRMAQVGGTGQAYQANDGRQLFEVFQAIVDAATAEVCDGVDNDCDGRVDEGIAPEPCETACGSGERLCVDGGLSECRGGDIPAEVCDAVDNDCDAAIDEVQAYPCTTVSGNPGTVACVEGVLSGDCAPDDPSREEICDGVDNDQDGAVDEGTTLPCADGCHMGRRLCVDGSLTRCSALPAGDERCNGADDDCDGVVDRAAPCPEGRRLQPRGPVPAALPLGGVPRPLRLRARRLLPPPALRPVLRAGSRLRARDLPAAVHAGRGVRRRRGLPGAALPARRRGGGSLPGAATGHRARRRPGPRRRDGAASDAGRRRLRVPGGRGRARVVARPGAAGPGRRRWRRR
ncbi:MAG: VWA domain-containing protein [bacterium]